MEKEENIISVSIILIGNQFTGKTALATRYSKNEYNEKYMATVGIDYFSKEKVKDGKKFMYKIWDSTGQERFATLTSNFLKNAQGVLLVYDITDKNSFELLDNWTRQIVNGCDKIPFYLAGNKKDLSKIAVVSTEDGKSYADKYNLKFFEVSAKTGENVNKCFDSLFDSIVDEMDISLSRTSVTLSAKSFKKRNKGKCEGCSF